MRSGLILATDIMEDYAGYHQAGLVGPEEDPRAEHTRSMTIPTMRATQIPTLRAIRRVA